MRLFFIVLGVLISVKGFSQKLFPNDIYSFIENPSVTQVNQEAGRSPFVPFLNVENALNAEKKQSDLFFSLKGEWQFNWSENYEKSTKDFFNQEFDDKKWAAIHVPSNWEMQGYGDPMFRNIQHPFTINPPFVPKDYNPVGQYRKTFNLPKNWRDKEIFLNIEGASSVSFVWVNGQEVGYNAGAFEPSEYNITPFLKSGSNNISIQVFKYSAGTYLEDQDFWRLSGIFRDVYLVATPKVHIQDFSVITDLDKDYKNAVLSLKASITNQEKATAKNYQIEAILLDNNKKTVLQSIFSPKISISENKTETLKIETKVMNPAKWTAETPNLYILVLKLKDATGKVTQVVTKKIGFKKTELSHQALLVNGVPVKLNGVNSHMQHPVLGHTMDIETIRKDLLLMKQFNINCVRTSHYPPNKEYLDIADELGIYIVDETGNESHATEYLSEKEEWTAAYINRVERMVLRDRSHPSIIFWSAGNESGFGKNICEVIKAGKKLDPTRLWMYGGNTDDPAWANEVPCEEIIGPRYPTPAELKYRIANVPESQDPRPSFMDEYAAATGNGAGGLEEYWDIIWNSPRVIGGAIWDWVSPGLKQKVRLLKDESPNQIITSINGRAKIVAGQQGSAIQFSGFDQWVDVYRHPALDIVGDQISISISLNPQNWNGNGSFLTKGSYQYGIIQNHKDSIQFYVGTANNGKLTVKIPEKWVGNWHKMDGIYDGKNLMIYIDGNLAGSKAHSGKIVNRPFPVNIGRNSEFVGQDYSERHTNAIIDEVLVFNKALPITTLLLPKNELKNTAVLFLDFKDVQEKGEYFSVGNDARSYGLITPDRKAEPELWQVKKSAQPVHTKIIDIEKGVFEITNRHRHTNLNEFQTVWQLFADEKIVQEGTLNVSIEPLKSIEVKIPFQKLQNTEGSTEHRFLISFRTKEDKAWAKSGFEVAWDEFILPVKIPTFTTKNPEILSISVVEKNDLLLVNGKDFEYAFSKTNGKLIALKYQNKELIGEGPKLNIWRAPLANELDAWAVTGADMPKTQGMGNDAANTWRTAGLDKLKYKLDKFSYVQKNENTAVIDVLGRSEGMDYKTIFEEHYSYTISGNGEILLNHSIVPQGFMPKWIPCIGNQWTINKNLNRVSWHGRGPFENYPDRKTGAKTGFYTSTVKDMEEAYLIPQDYGLRTENRWVRLEGEDGYGLEFKGDKWFDFAAQSFDTDNLTRAKYPFQLQPQNNITLNLNYETSGVGCTATSVLNQFRVAPKSTFFNFTIRPYHKN